MLKQPGETRIYLPGYTWLDQQPLGLTLGYIGIDRNYTGVTLSMKMPNQKLTNVILILRKRQSGKMSGLIGNTMDFSAKYVWIILECFRATEYKVLRVN